MNRYTILIFTSVVTLVATSSPCLAQRRGKTVPFVLPKRSTVAPLPIGAHPVTNKNNYLNHLYDAPLLPEFNYRKSSNGKSSPPYSNHPVYKSPRRAPKTAPASSVPSSRPGITAGRAR